MSATEDLEYIALVQIHSGAAPYLGIFTVAGSEDCHGKGLYIVALAYIVNVRLSVTGVEYLAFFQYILIDVDDHVAVHMSAVVAATIDVAVQQAQVLVEGACGKVFHEIAFFLIPFGGVPFQFCSYLG